MLSSLSASAAPDLTPHGYFPRTFPNSRALVAIPREDGTVLLSWRARPNEEDLRFFISRDTGTEKTELRPGPGNSTNLIDPNPVDGATYSISTNNALELTEYTSLDFSKGYLPIPLKTPDGYHPSDATAADLNNDGQYELILKQEARTKDNSQSGTTDPVILQAYALEGDLLWQINLGPNIRAGAHYTQFQVFDYDRNGTPELICKTADGTTDAEGTTIGDPDARHANRGGYILKGPEYLTVFNARTGTIIDTVQYLPQRDPERNDDNPDGPRMKRDWGDDYGNRMDRFLAGTAHLDGPDANPSAIFTRGYYTRSFAAAYDFDGKHLTQRWLFDSEDPASVGDAPQSTDGRRHRNPYSGQGFHSLSIADADNDGKQEIIFGAMVIDDDGTGLYTTGHGHGDALHVSDFDPDNPGLEVFGIQERFDDAGAYMYDAATGRTLWKHPSVRAATSGGDRGEGPGRGVAADIDPRFPGAESWAAGAGMTGLWNAKGEMISDNRPDSCNFLVYWDGDPLRELLDRNRVSKWNWQTESTDRLITFEGCRSNNGTKATPTLSADILGDWREEIVLPTEDNTELRIFTTNIPTDIRHPTLMADPQYRAAIAWQNTAYNQPPHPATPVTAD